MYISNCCITQCDFGEMISCLNINFLRKNLSGSYNRFLLFTYISFGLISCSPIRHNTFKGLVSIPCLSLCHWWYWWRNKLFQNDKTILKFDIINSITSSTPYIYQASNFYTILNNFLYNYISHFPYICAMFFLVG